jgi:pyruvate carboxylase
MVRTPAATAGFPVKTLNRLLIANRGEIAVRIARTARRMGIATVAVCSDADRGQPFVAACDEHVPIGGNLPAESYLLIDKIIAAALESKASYIISEDKHLLDLGDYQGVTIMNREQFWTELNRLDVPE